MTGELSVPEREALLASLQQDDQENGWRQIFLEISNEQPGDMSYAAEDWESVIRDILATSAVKKIGRRWWTYVAAAIIIAALGIGLYQYTHQKPVQPAVATIPPKNDALPGGNKAILKLANGRNIVLDSAANGSLAVQGNANVVKLANGRLAYQNRQNAQREPVYNTVSTPRGGQYNLTLSDGTQVWLNAASSITFPTDFTGDRREVTVTGEAYFEVAGNNTKPFHVLYDHTDIQVLGTHFNVNTYEDEAFARTTLLEGRVRVVSGGQQILLLPGQQAAQAADGQLSKNTKVDLEQVMAWKNGLFNFDGADLQQVLRQLGRWYDVDVVYEGNVPERRFGGEIPRDLNLSQVLKVLQKVEVKFRIDGKKLIVSSH